MVKIVTLLLLFACTVWAKPLDGATFQLGINLFTSSLAELGMGSNSNEDDDDDCTSSEVTTPTASTTSDDDVDGKNEIDSDATTDNPWHCSKSDGNLIRCVLKTNTTKAEVVYSRSKPSNQSIPAKPPKSVAPDFAESKIDGALESYMNKWDDFLNDIDKALKAMKSALAL